MLAGIILAAGDSSRMGSPKALLTDRLGEPFVTRIARSMRAAGLTEIIVVTGRHHDDIAATVARTPLQPAPRVVRNADPSRGQLSSLWTGLDACPPGTDGIAVTLVDVPLVTPGTIEAVIAAWSRSRAPVVRPSYGDRRGHPVIFDRAIFDEIRRAPLDVGARAVVSAHYDAIVNVQVDDPGCLVDIDTPADYSRALDEGFSGTDSGVRR